MTLKDVFKCGIHCLAFQWYVNCLCTIEPSVVKSLVTYPCCEAPYSRVTFAFHLRRKPLYYIINLIAPCCLFSFMAVATFILQPSCSERLGLSKGRRNIVTSTHYCTGINDYKCLKLISLKLIVRATVIVLKMQISFCQDSW